jgi:hypothetical protein
MDPCGVLLFLRDATVQGPDGGRPRLAGGLRRGHESGEEARRGHRRCGECCSGADMPGGPRGAPIPRERRRRSGSACSGERDLLPGGQQDRSHQQGRNGTRRSLYVGVSRSLLHGRNDARRRGEPGAAERAASPPPGRDARRGRGRNRHRPRRGPRRGPPFSGPTRPTFMGSGRTPMATRSIASAERTSAISRR